MFCYTYWGLGMLQKTRMGTSNFWFLRSFFELTRVYNRVAGCVNMINTRFCAETGRMNRSRYCMRVVCVSVKIWVDERFYRSPDDAPDQTGHHNVYSQLGSSIMVHVGDAREQLQQSKG